RSRFVTGALGKGVEEELAHVVYDKLVAFSGFGFPKSHAAAFGLLAYQSAWLRHHYRAEFLASLLNAQPMGFYPPATLVRDGQRHGVETRPPDVNRSGVQCELEDGTRSVGGEAADARLENRAASGSAWARAGPGDRAGLGGRGETACAAARADGRDAGAARADRVGADARRLPDDDDLRRRAPARAHASAPAAGDALHHGAAGSPQRLE